MHNPVVAGAHESMNMLQSGCPSGDSAQPARRKGVIVGATMVAVLGPILLAACTDSGGIMDARGPARPISEEPAMDPATSEITLAARLLNGRDMPGDPARAIALLRPHAAAGDPQAQFLLGLAHASGKGVERSAAEAVAWYRKAAVQDHPEAQYLLALSLLRGSGSDRDPQTATRWFDRAARAGHAGAQYHLGLAYAEGVGVDRNDTAATEWLERAAGQGHAEAQYLTGEAYQIGRGVRENRRWAARWFARAASQGVADAQYMLGLSYAAGSGVPQDMDASLYWLELATRRGAESAAAMRDRIAAQLDHEARRAAVQKADSWGPVRADQTARLDDPPSVLFVQYSLSRLGYDPGPMDGFLGPQTREAISAYLAERGDEARARLDADLMSSLRDEVIAGEAL